MARSFVPTLAFLLALAPLAACGGDGGGGGSSSSPGAIGAACSSEAACDAACDGDADCEEATLCLTGDDFPGGLCTRACNRSDDCPNPTLEGSFENVCIVDPATSLAACVNSCAVDADCRGGYVCRAEGGARGCILAPPSVPFPADIVPVRDPECLGPQSGEVTLTFRVPEMRASFMVVPYTLDGAAIRPLGLTYPDGTTTLNLEGREGLLGAAAADVVCLAINFPFFALGHEGAWERLGPLWHRFLRRYLGRSGDAGLLEAAPPYLAWRALVLASPAWYPHLAEEDRDALLCLAERVLARGALELGDAERMFS